MAERIEIPDETAEAAVPEETEAASAPEEQTEPGMEAAAAVELSGSPEDGAPQEENAPPEEAESIQGVAHGLSGATMDTLSRTDEQSLAEADAERTKWERRRAQLQGRLMEAYRKYMDDGGFKLGISLATAVIAASIIVITGIFSERMLSVVFLRALVGFCVSSVFMGGVLYWLDEVGIPLFIAKNEEQLQTEWLSEAEEPGQPEEEAAEPKEEAEPGALEELMPQEGESVPEAAAETEAKTEETEEAAPLREGADISEGESDGETRQEAPAGQEDQAELPQEQTEEAQSSGEDMDGIESAVLDDAFSSEEAEEEVPEEPPVFAPMTADNLESLSVPEEDGDS